MEHTTPASKAASAPTTQAAPENIRSILVRCREFIDTTKAPAYPAGADLADEIDMVLAAQPAAAPAAAVGLGDDLVTYESAMQAIEHVAMHNSASREREAVDMLVAAPAAQAAPAAVAVPVKWWNGCDVVVPAALRYLANNKRPNGGEERFNSAHLYQLADEIERMARLPLYTAPAPAAQGESNG